MSPEDEKRRKNNSSGMLSLHLTVLTYAMEKLKLVLFFSDVNISGVPLCDCRNYIPSLKKLVCSLDVKEQVINSNNN